MSHPLGSLKNSRGHEVLLVLKFIPFFLFSFELLGQLIVWEQLFLGCMWY